MVMHYHIGCETFIHCHGQAMMIFRGNIDNDENFKKKKKL